MNDKANPECIPNGFRVGTAMRLGMLIGKKEREIKALKELVDLLPEDNGSMDLEAYLAEYLK